MSFLQNIVCTVRRSTNTMMNQLSLIQSQTLGFDDWISSPSSNPLKQGKEIFWIQYNSTDLFVLVGIGYTVELYETLLDLWLSKRLN
jgi:hypothetical protein